jgi:hypothetical protein
VTLRHSAFPRALRSLGPVMRGLAVIRQPF